MNKKVTTVALAGLMAVSSAAVASNARWGGLGLSSTFVADVQDTWTLPTALLDNGDALFVDYGAIGAYAAGPSNNTGAVFGGVNFSLLGGQLGLWTGRGVGQSINSPGRGLNGVGGQGTVGTRPAVGAVDPFTAAVLPAAITGMAGYVAPPGFAAIVSDIDLLYGLSLNDNTQLAIGINKSSGTGTAQGTLVANSGRTEQKVTANASGFGVSLGLGMSEIGPLSGLWAGIAWQGNNWLSQAEQGGSVATGANKQDIKKTRATSDINLRVAGEIAGDANISQLFDVNVQIESSEDKADISADISGNGTYDAGEEFHGKVTNSAMDIALGWAMSGSGEAGMALSGLILNFGNSSDKLETTSNAAGANTPKNEYTTSNFGLKWVAGGEVKAKEYLTLRAGVSGDIFGSDSTVSKYDADTAGTPVDERKTDGHVPGGATASLGFSVPMGAFVFDAVANQDFLYSGPFFVSGIAEGLATQVALTYAWGGQQ